MKWEDCLPYAELSYNNSFQASSGKAPFEILYGGKCRTPLNWSETGERQLLGNCQGYTLRYDPTGLGVFIGNPLEWRLTSLATHGWP